jgi:glycogen debranching enzyme
MTRPTVGESPVQPGSPQVPSGSDSPGGPHSWEPTRPAATLLQIGTDYYIIASALSSRRSTRSLANDQSFAVFDAGGDILDSRLEPVGFFHRDTRHLSRFELRIGGEFPYYLNSYVADDGAELCVNLTNPDLRDGEQLQLRRDSLQVERAWVMFGSRLTHRILLRNFAMFEVAIVLDLVFRSDFADVFEVRGLPRTHRSPVHARVIGANRVEFSQCGLDGILRATSLLFEPPPERLSTRAARFQLTLQPGEERRLETEIAALSGESDESSKPSVPQGFAGVLVARRVQLGAATASWAGVSTDDDALGRLIRWSRADLVMLTMHSERGCCVQAGIPWFATLFGRDSLLTALSALWLNPRLGAGTLRSLAALQGSEVNPERDEQPGKIVHELRAGEMANTGEIPFGRYYGSADSTPLFLLLFGRYVLETGDLELATELWPHVERALSWIEEFGDRDGDGFVEYLAETPRGLMNQGWKDSFDAISHADGRLAEPPVALAEVQAYVYAAYLAVAEVAASTDRKALAVKLRARAEALRDGFHRAFWLEDDQLVALALDANKEPCRVMSSNAGQCLAMGLLEPDPARSVAERLTRDDMFSGWGIRTLSARERRYNPMGYHIGSIWPHDNALCAVGLRRAGDLAGVLRVTGALVDASGALHASLPELFCGFPREPRRGPVPYPVACHPQAWAAGSVFLLLQAMLGLSLDGFAQRLSFQRPVLPRSVGWLRLDDLPVGRGSASLMLLPRGDGTSAKIEILDKSPNVEIEWHE